MMSVSLLRISCGSLNRHIAWNTVCLTHRGNVLKSARMSEKHSQKTPSKAPSV